MLVPALELARLGHLPIGGGKWRGAGWIPWHIEKIELARAGPLVKAENRVEKESLSERINDVVLKLQEDS